MTVQSERVERRRVVSRRSWRPTGFGPGMIVGSIGAVGAVIAMFLPWRAGGVHPSGIPLEFLWDTTPSSQDPSLLIVLAPIAILLVIGALVPMGVGLRIFGGIALVLVAAVYAYQLDRAPGAAPGTDLGDALDSGFYVAVISGIVAFASALVPSGWGAERDEVIESAVDEQATGAGAA